MAPPSHDVFSLIQFMVLNTNLSISSELAVSFITDCIKALSSDTPAFAKCEWELEEFAFIFCI